MSEKLITPCLCLRCGYEWKSTIPEGPAACPNCKSTFWDVPLVGQGNQLYEH